MKKIFAVFAIVALELSFLAGEKFSAFQKDAPLVQSAMMNWATNTNTGFESYMFSLQSKYIFELPQVDFSCGSLMASGTFDFTTDANYWPIFFRLFRAGIFVRYHYGYISDLSNTNDFIAGARMDWRPCSWHRFQFAAAYFFKLTELIPLREYGGLWLKNNSWMMELKSEFMPIKPLHIFISLSSTEYFRYNIFFAPSWTLGVTYDFDNGLYTGLESVSRWIDMFTLSAHHEGREFRLIMGYRW